ncbi:hypothetical protein AK830_g11540 [Neonectria ditissima]|uniref:SGNH hydrolase-type esterase domain-containing protein n=1 Tax=Neonectria ditissima TaxID=78410 RepID=A0A0P7ACK4_9HYPO|nr:hypothetical protein AK830_g11540 [Neonectria ditissima]
MATLNFLSLRPLGLLLLLSTSAVSGTPTPQGYPSIAAREIPIPTKYFAFGDSFAAGIGAGSEFGTTHLDECHRYDRGYPSMLQAFINGHSIQDENLHACTGARAEQVKDQSTFLDETVDLATISAGGNNVGFGAIVNDCIYRFKGILSGDCQATLKASENAVQNELGPAVLDALQAFMNRPHHENLRIFVTGYAQFFNADSEQCDGVSWNYWQWSPEAGSGTKLTKDLRAKLNDLVVQVNSKIDAVVRSFNDDRIQFVNYDDSFRTHRFCEERLDLFMHQYYTPDGQFQDGGEYFDVNDSEDAKDWAEGMRGFVNSYPDTQVAMPFDEHPVDIGQLEFRIPSGVMKVFHPTQKGHEQIAIAVWNAYTHATALQPGGLQPLPEGFPIGDSGTRVSGNFPRSFVLTDSNQPVREILYRMRDQACQGLCEVVSGIPGDFYISNWDDGDWGKSILHAVTGCHLSPSRWRYEDAPSDGVSPHTFADGTQAQKWGKWNMVISNGGCAESKIEEALGLRAGGLDCPFDDWFELDLFK